jgi:hypothetical protein
MRYSVFENDKPITDLSFLFELVTAKMRAEQVAADRPDSEFRIVCYPEESEALAALTPVPNWRLDREANVWVETHSTERAEPAQPAHGEGGIIDNNEM